MISVNPGTLVNFHLSRWTCYTALQDLLVTAPTALRE